MYKIFIFILCFFIINSSESIIGSETNSRVVKFKTCSDLKLSVQKEFNALGSTLGQVRREGNDIGPIRSVQAGPFTAWAFGSCLGNNCRSCISDLIDAIWDICGNAKEADVQYEDCSIRYGFYES